MNRYESMMNHLLVQFSDTKVLQAIFCAISDELQLLDDTFNNLKEKRWIDTGEGAQLDGIGEIVDRNRLINNAITINFLDLKIKLILLVLIRLVLENIANLIYPVHLCLMKNID